MKLKKYSKENQVSHSCEAYRDQQWIVYSCVDCDYELRENLNTGELKVKNPKPNIRHSGSYISEEYHQALYSGNLPGWNQLNSGSKN